MHTFEEVVKQCPHKPGFECTKLARAFEYATMGLNLDVNKLDILAAGDSFVRGLNLASTGERGNDPASRDDSKQRVFELLAGKQSLFERLVKRPCDDCPTRDVEVPPAKF